MDNLKKETISINDGTNIVKQQYYCWLHTTFEVYTSLQLHLVFFPVCFFLAFYRSMNFYLLSIIHGTEAVCVFACLQFNRSSITYIIIQTYTTFSPLSTEISLRSSWHMIGICLSSPVWYNAFFWTITLNDDYCKQRDTGTLYIE